MGTTAQELYAEAVRRLPPKERLRLAVLILEELTRTADALNFSDEWSDEDQRDLSAFALAHAARVYGDDEELG